MNAIFLITAISTRLQTTCVRRWPVGCWLWPLVLSGHTYQP